VQGRGIQRLTHDLEKKTEGGWRNLKERIDDVVGRTLKGCTETISERKQPEALAEPVTWSRQRERKKKHNKTGGRTSKSRLYTVTWEALTQK